MRLIDFFRKKVPLRTENFNNSEITLLPKEMRERAEYLLTIKNPRKTFSRVRGKKYFQIVTEQCFLFWEANLLKEQEK
jgi:hypothetical protein